MEVRGMKTFPADVDSLPVALDFVRDTMKEAEISQEMATRIELVVEEVFVNIALYAYKESEPRGDIAIRCAVSPESVFLEFTDSGVPFNPLEREDPDVFLGAEGREPGGLGLFIVKKIMDAVEYRREGERNVLRMSKRPVP
jgi:sigma-B regulation protein RsbU (phosphoserine phosphatase)